MWRVNYQESLPLLKRYRENSLPSDSPEMHRIRAAAKENQIFVSLGYSEVDLNSLYTTQVLISPTGDILNHRRKIRATHVERLVFGDSTGDTTESVVDTEIGRVGQLNCWENMKYESLDLSTQSRVLIISALSSNPTPSAKANRSTSPAGLFTLTLQLSSIPTPTPTSPMQTPISLLLPMPSRPAPLLSLPSK